MEMEGQVEHNELKEIVCSEVYSIVVQDFCILNPAKN